MGDNVSRLLLTPMTVRKSCPVLSQINYVAVKLWTCRGETCLALKRDFASTGDPVARPLSDGSLVGVNQTYTLLRFARPPVHSDCRGDLWFVRPNIPIPSR